jgi:AraC family transcriptional regulator
VAVDPFSTLQRSVFTNGRGFSYYAETPGLPLSLKSMSNGRARYRFGRKEVTVDDGGYLILNENEPYSIEIASPTLVETFVLWFPAGWAAEVRQSVEFESGRLLDTWHNDEHTTAHFHDAYVRHDRSVSPKLGVLRAALKSRQMIDDAWLEERLRELLASMLITQAHIRFQVAGLPAVRAATRAELWRRACCARDYLHAHLNTSPRLSDVATIACLSPFHLLRVFRSAFGVTPHQYLSRCRIERAKFLLEKTNLPVTAICLECGFTSLGSFSSLFHRNSGCSPTGWREGHGAVPKQNSNIKEVYLSGAT